MAGIVTVPDPITGGAGAAVTTTEVINAMWQNAAYMSTQGNNYVLQAIGLSGPPPQIANVPLDKSYLPPVPPAFPSMDPGNGEAIYDAKLAEMMQLITSGMQNYITTYLPHPEYAENALAWCDRAIREGGTGMNYYVEQQLWERGKSRVQAESDRSEDEAMNVWAGRRFPVPPGALTSQVIDIRLDAARKLGEINRDISIKSFDQEIENLKFAITTVMDHYKAVMNSAIDYIRVLMQGPQTAMQLATGLTGIQNDYLRSLVGYYNAQVTALEPTVRLAITDAQLKLEVEKANQAAQVGTIEAKAKSALTGAQMFATQASAGINAINASASISGSDSTSL